MLKALRRLAKHERAQPPESKKPLREVKPWDEEAETFGVRLLEPGEWGELDRWAVAEAFGEDYLRERLKGTKREKRKP